MPDDPATDDATIAADGPCAFAERPETLEEIEAGELKPLGAFSDERLDVLPDVPTFEEAGI